MFLLNAIFHIGPLKKKSLKVPTNSDCYCVHCGIPESGPDMRVAEMRMASKEKEDEILHLMNTICMIQRERQSITEAVDKIQQQKFEELSEEYQTYQENTDKHIEDLQSLVEVKNKAGHIFVQ